jgi:hypothetical protein
MMLTIGEMHSFRQRAQDVRASLRTIVARIQKLNKQFDRACAPRYSCSRSQRFKRRRYMHLRAAREMACLHRKARYDRA